jgi:hypothetical protein
MQITARRDEGRRIIVDVFRQETLDTLGEEYDPWLFSMLQAATEHAGEILVQEGLRPGDAKRVKQSMMRILAATLSEGDVPLPPIPRAPKKAKMKRAKRTQTARGTKSKR